MDVTFALSLLSSIGGDGMINHWNQLNAAQKKHLFEQLRNIDLPTLHLQQAILREQEPNIHPIEPFTHYSEIGNLKDKHLGQECIAKGLVGCLIVAGGQGTRLHFDGPKGMCEVTKIHKKSLFQLFAEKTLAAGKQAGRPLPLAIMTSPLNHETTVKFFEENAYFGIDKKQLSFFQQGTLPLLNQQAHVFLETEEKISEGPDGNGGALHHFFSSGLWDKWHSKGVRYLNFILIDNPLADPFDAELIGFHHRNKSDVVIKCIRRDNPEEKVGVIVQEKSRSKVIEYTELTQEDRFASNPEGKLRHPLANLSLFSFHMDFVKHAAVSQPILHKTFKAAKYLDFQNRTITPKEPMAWKFERFIFDLLPLASKVDALVYPREICFAPLKNATGPDSVQTVAEAIEKMDRTVLTAITKTKWENSPLEIAQDFYYPTPELLLKWSEKKQPYSGYIEA